MKGHHISQGCIHEFLREGLIFLVVVVVMGGGGGGYGCKTMGSGGGFTPKARLSLDLQPLTLIFFYLQLHDNEIRYYGYNQ